MASGDVVFEAVSMAVVKSLSGKGPDSRHFLYSGDGYEVGLNGNNASGHGSYLNDLWVTDEVSPFDPAKTYDVVIKEH